MSHIGKRVAADASEQLRALVEACFEEYPRLNPVSRPPPWATTATTTGCRRLRERAERALGPRFDVRAFPAQLLNDGALPLAVLEAKIARRIADDGS